MAKRYTIKRKQKPIGTITGLELETEDLSLQRDWDDLVENGVTILGSATAPEGVIADGLHTFQLTEENLHLFLWELLKLNYIVD